MTSPPRDHARDPAPGSRPPLRRDIQGLRAIAVLSVVLFHAGLPLAGGFIGVDIFFVISGFVITGMLLREWQRTGTISLPRFYLRRFKRLTPALAVMVTVTLIGAVLLFSPFDQQVIAGQTALGALFIVANWVIATTTGGYFDLAADSNPLLHTWSLSVEEQFYVFFPGMLLIVLLIAHRWTRLRWVPVAVIAGVAAVSIAGTLYALKSVLISSGALLGFYSTITRAWEFAAGAILALVAHRIAITSARLATVLGIVGAVLVVGSFFVFSGSTAWPGPLTALPIVGTLLMIVAGLGPPNPVTRALSTRPMVTIGDLSYSLYLWHWPFIAFALAIWPFTPWVAMVAALLSAVPAVASYLWVERPIRMSGIATIRRALPALTGFIVVPAVVAAGVLWAAPNVFVPAYQAGAVSEVLEGGIDTIAYNAQVEAESYPCTPQAVYDDAPEWAGYVRCRQSQPGEDVTVAIIGDSHAEHLFPGLANALPEQNVAYYVDDLLPVRGTERMDRILDALVASDTVQTVIVSVNWTGKGVQVDALAAMITELTDAGKRVFVSDDNPTFGFGPFMCKYRQGLLLGKRCDMDAAPFREVYDRYRLQLDRVIAAAPGSRLLSVADYFCSPETCSMRMGSEVLFRDVNHLNELGSAYVAQHLLRDDPALADGLGRLVLDG
jgi:peptidoglycan/LPS O-acetylase OafA/YrhL